MCSHILPGPSRERSSGFDSERICESQIDRLVMAITAAEAIVRHTTPPSACCSRADWMGEIRAHEQYMSVCRYRRFACDWFRSMGGLAHQCACFPFDRTGDSSVPTNDERKGTANGGVCRLHVRVQLSVALRSESRRPSRMMRPRLATFR